MVRIDNTGNEKLYFCEKCEKLFHYYGIADNHEKWECRNEVEGKASRLKIEESINLLEKEITKIVDLNKQDSADTLLIKSKEKIEISVAMSYQTVKFLLRKNIRK